MDQVRAIRSVGTHGLLFYLVTYAPYAYMYICTLATVLFISLESNSKNNKTDTVQDDGNPQKKDSDSRQSLENVSRVGLNQNTLIKIFL